MLVKDQFNRVFLFLVTCFPLKQTSNYKNRLLATQNYGGWKRWIWYGLNSAKRVLLGSIKGIQWKQTVESAINGENSVSIHNFFPTFSSSEDNVTVFQRWPAEGRPYRSFECKFDNLKSAGKIFINNKVFLSKARSNTTCCWKAIPPLKEENNAFCSTYDTTRCLLRCYNVFVP